MNVRQHRKKTKWERLRKGMKTERLLKNICELEKQYRKDN